MEIHSFRFTNVLVADVEMQIVVTPHEMVYSVLSSDMTREATVRGQLRPVHSTLVKKLGASFQAKATRRKKKRDQSGALYTGVR